MTTRAVKVTTPSTLLDTNILESMQTTSKDEPVESKFDSQSTKVTGLAKLKNKVFRLLWTKRGSNPLNPTEGTDLIDLYTYSIGDEESTYVAVQTALSDALSQIQAQQASTGAPAVERLTAIELKSLSYKIEDQSPVFDITISIYSAAGEMATYELPTTVA